MKPTRFHKTAERELLEAALFYENRQPGLGQRWQATVSSVIRKLSVYPSVGRPAGPIAKRLTVPSFPYQVIFLNRTDEIYVLAIVHQRRRPGYWFDRLEDAS